MIEPRRYLVTVGVSDYDRLPHEHQLPNVKHEVRTIVQLFCDLGYERVMQDLAASPPAETIRARLSSWLIDDDRRPEDLLVLYWSGHGEVGSDGRHHLLGASFAGNHAAEALATEDLGHMLAASPIHTMLVLIDTCHAGQGIIDLQSMGRAIEAHDDGVVNEPGGGIHLVASSRHKELAAQALFTALLVDAVDAQRHGGVTQPWLDPSAVIGAINDRMRRQRVAQRAVFHRARSGGGLSPLIPNPRFTPDMPDELPVERARELLKRPDLLAHWGPRARGVGLHIESGDYFEGRIAVLRALVEWLREGGPGMRVVTGRPGSGKSTVLARLTILSAPEREEMLDLAGVDRATIPDSGSINVAIHVRGKTVLDVVGELADALGVGVSTSAVIEAIVAWSVPLVVVIDALDEALDPRGVAREVIRPLLDTRRVRVLVGSRSHMLGALTARGDQIVDLDEPRWFAASDVVRYVDRLLAAADAASKPSPYAKDGRLRGVVASQVALRAGRTFLIARLVARSLAEREQVINVGDPTWSNRLPSTVGEAFEEWLDRFGPDKGRARDLLRPLAYADGGGLPWEDVWPPIAGAIAGRAYGDSDVEWLLDVAGAFVIESRILDRSVYRLFHEALAEHLRPADRERTNQRRIAATLLETVPVSDGIRSWEFANDYVRRHLATHCAAGELLDKLCDDVGFVVAADPTRLLRALSTTDDARLDGVRRAYSNAFHMLIETSPADRPSYLQLYAHNQQVPKLARQLDERFPSRAWSVRWTHVRVDTEHFIVGRHDHRATSVAAAVVDDRPLAVSAGMDGTARIWDLAARAPVGQPLVVGRKAGGFDSVNTSGHFIGVATVEGLPVIAISYDGEPVRLWDLQAGCPLIEERPASWGRRRSGLVVTKADRVWLIGANGVVLTAQSLSLDGETRAAFETFTRLRSVVAIVTCGDRVFALGPPERQRSRRLPDVYSRELATESTEAKLAQVNFTHVAGTTIGGQPAVVATDSDGTLNILDPVRGGHLRRPIKAGVSDPTALAAGEIAGQSLLAIAGRGHAIHLFDLAAPHREAVLPPLVGHIGAVRGLVVTELDGHPAIVSASDDRTIRVWDPQAGGRAPKQRTGQSGPVSSIDIDGSGEDGVLVSADGGSGVSLRGAGDGERTVPDFRCTTHAVAVRRKGGRRYVAVATDQDVRLYAVADGGKTLAGGPLDGISGRAQTVAFSDVRGRLLVVAGVDRLLAIWDVRRRELTGPPLRAHDAGIAAAAIGAFGDTPIIVTGGNAGSIAVWDVERAKEFRSKIKGHERFVTAIAVGAAGTATVAASASGAGDLMIWDVETMQQIGEMSTRDKSEWIRALALGEVDGQPAVISGGDDSIVRFNALDGTLLRTIAIGWPVRSLSLSGTLLVAGTPAGMLGITVRG